MYSELKDTNVSVTVVHPGAVATNITENSGMKQHDIDKENAPENGMALSAEKAVKIIIKAMEKNKFRATVGKDTAILDFLYRLSPKFASNLIRKMMKKHVVQMS